MRLRPYKSCDALFIEKWINNKEVFQKWGGELFGDFPINANIINEKYLKNNGDCVESDNFYPWTAIDDNNKPIGHFIMRYTNKNSKNLRFGWVIVDNSVRKKGYGKQMLMLGIKYAFEILKVEKITIGVFENNEPAHNCYKKVGFIDKEITNGNPWKIIEMEMKREEL